MSKVSEGKKCCALPWTCIVQRAKTREGARCCNSTQLLQMSSVVSLVMRAPTLEKRGEEKREKKKRKKTELVQCFFQKQGDAVQTKSARCHQGAPPICLWVSVRSLGCTTIANASSCYARKYLYAAYYLFDKHAVSAARFHFYAGGFCWFLQGRITYY